MVVFSAASVACAAPVDESKARSEGIRKLTSRHLVLYTDLSADPEVDRLPALFDEAVPQWAEYFGVSPPKTANWQARAFLIRERRRFDAIGLMPAGNDQFINGISVGTDLWLYDQPTPYYRRHLLLHEGTHVFMVAFLGGCGPGWYMEGTAELMATHRLDDQTGKLALRIMPRSRTEVPMLGRIKLIADALASDRGLNLPAIMEIDNRQQLGNEAYAWCWAACKFLDTHARYHDRFQALRKHVLNPSFNDIVRREYADDWSTLNTEFQAFVATLEHGYDFERMAIFFRPGKPLAGGEKKVTIAADRGWQSSGVRLEAETEYRITAAGRYQIGVDQTGDRATPLSCEPGGITIEYHDGRPLGMLLGAIMEQSPGGQRDVVAHEQETNGGSFTKPLEIGLSRTIRPPVSGTLYLRVNDSAAQLNDNRGTLTVTVSHPNGDTQTTQ